MLKIIIKESSSGICTIFSKKGETGDVLSLVELFILPDIYGGQQCGYIHKVNTNKEHEGKGYASELLKCAKDYAKLMGCHKIFLICHLDVSEFYVKNGFEVDMQVVMVKRF